MIICPECFERLPDNAKYCGKCKVELALVQDKLMPCPNCKSRVPRDFERCPNCGYPFKVGEGQVTSRVRVDMTLRNVFFDAFRDIGKISLVSFTVLIVLAVFIVGVSFILNLRENMLAQLVLFSWVMVLGFGGMHFMFGVVLLKRMWDVSLENRVLAREAGVFFGIVLVIGGIGLLQVFLGVLAPIFFFTGLITLEGSLLFALAQFLYKFST